jgi:hypothetical protein
MLTRLGNVLFGAGIIIAVGWLALMYFAFASRSKPLDVVDVLVIACIPVLSVGIGWALRYILAGSS